MAKYQSELLLDLSAANSIAACRKAVSAAGWQIANQHDNWLSCTEQVPHSRVFTESPELEIRIIPQTDATVKIIMSVAYDGAGPADSAWFKDKWESLVEKITRELEPFFARGESQQSIASRRVFINGVQIGDEQLIALEQMYQVPVRDGAYWYDHFCGAWGIQGGPVAGMIQPGLNLGGPLRPDASKGNTGVFVNGRQLHLMDVLALQQLGPVYPGRYWLDAQGNVGFEGGFAFANLWALSRASGVNSGGAWMVNSSVGTVGGDGSGFQYFQGNDGTFYSPG